MQKVGPLKALIANYHHHQLLFPLPNLHNTKINTTELFAAIAIATGTIANLMGFKWARLKMMMMIWD